MRTVVLDTNAYGRFLSGDGKENEKRKKKKSGAGR